MSQGGAAERHPQGPSSSNTTEYEPLAPRTPSTTAYSGSSEAPHTNGSPRSLPPSAVTAMEFHDSQGLTPVQRWAARASDTQFNALA
ncbi:hypothetical protein CIB48_g12345, partial [Xylaria polymorpha]